MKTKVSNRGFHYYLVRTIAVLSRQFVESVRTKHEYGISGPYLPIETPRSPQLSNVRRLGKIKELERVEVEKNAVALN